MSGSDHGSTRTHRELLQEFSIPLILGVVVTPLVIVLGVVLRVKDVGPRTAPTDPLPTPPSIPTSVA